MKNQKGFSLIELLIVVAIIGIIAAIAIPNLLASRRAANEGSAQSSVRTTHSAQATYAATVGNGLYSANMTTLNTNNLIDGQLGGGTKSGYNFDTVTDNAATPPNFLLRSKPANTAAITRTGNRAFCMLEDGVMRAAVADAYVADRAACTALTATGN